MVVSVEERYEQYSVIHVGVGASTDQKPPDSSFPVGVYLRAGYDNRDLLGHAWTLTSAFTYGTAILRANVGFLDRRFLGTLFRLDASFTYLNQATVRLGDIHSGGGSVGLSRELFPGVDAGLHYNLRNTTHTEPLVRQAGPSKPRQRHARHHHRQPERQHRVAAHGQSPAADARLPGRRHRRAGAARVLDPAAAVPVRHRRRQLPEGRRSRAFGDPAGQARLPAPRLPLRPAFRWAARRCCPRSNATSPAETRRSAAIQLDRARVEVVEQPLAPVDPRNPAAGGVYLVEYRPLGGNLRIVQNIDLQIPIAPPWYGAVFMDNGVVADSLDHLGLRQFRHGVGDFTAAHPAADRRRQPGLGLAAGPRPRRHAHRRAARERRLDVLA